METLDSNYICPVCGYSLGFAPWQGDSAADEICPCCGIQFGYDDFAGGNSDLRQGIYDKWRDNWIQLGMKWSSKGIAQPNNWNPEDQLQSLKQE